MVMNLTKMAVAIVLVGMFIAGVSSFINSVDNVQNLGLNQSQFNTLVKIGEVSGNATRAGDNIYSGGIQEADTLATFSSKGFESAKDLGRIPSIANALVNDMFNLVGFTGMSPIFLTGMLTLATILVASALIALIMKVRP